MQREGYYGKPADVWSLGVLLYRLATGLFPFKGSNEKALFSSVMKGDLKLPGEMSPQLQSLLAKMLSFDFRKRPTMDEIGSSEWLEMQP
jgi:MAP/microtubule affinity-regulating kinase